MEATVDSVAGPAKAPRRAGVGRPFWAVIGAIVVLLVVGVVVALRNSDSKGTVYPLSTPQGVVQRYLSDLQAGKVDAAYDLTVQFITRQEFHNRFDNWNSRSHRVDLAATHVDAETATVSVDISTFSAGPTGADSSTNRVTFSLVRHAKTWRISDPDYLP